MDASHESITIPLASLFEKLEQKLDRIEQKLDQKADAVVVEDHGKRIAKLENRSVAVDEVESYRRWLIALGISVIVMFAAVSALLVRLLVG